VYEHRTMPLLPRRQFVVRLLWHVGFALLFLGASLAVGMIGYRKLAGLSWVGAFLNASMILGGMGPVNDLPRRSAKIFAGCYAIYSGIGLLASVGLIIAPLAHRLLHRLHLDR
jgi:hypothetical protein